MQVEDSSLSRSLPILYKKRLPAEMRIVDVNGIAVESSVAQVQIDKLSINGLRFSSELLFPDHPAIILNFKVGIGNESIDLRGTISSCMQEELAHVYTIAFGLKEETETMLCGMLSNIARHYLPLHLRAEYYYNYFSQASYDFKNSRINILQ